jgi:subtilase family serine protease
VVLKLPEQAAFDRAVDALYEPGSASYHRWLTPADLQDYAPTAADFAAVQAALVRQGLRVVSADPQRFSVRVRGSVDTIQKAFQTELHTVVYRGTAYQAHIRDARLADPAAALIAAVAGIDRQRVTPQAKLATNPITGKALFPRRVLKTAPAPTLPGEITDVALSATSQFAYTTPGAALPTASYSGTV